MTDVPGTPLLSKLLSLRFESPAMDKLGTQERAELLYGYCVTSDKKVSETVHNLFIIAKHYSVEHPDDLPSPTEINGIPRFFENLTAPEKAEYCYNQVIEGLSHKAQPVTVESLRATTRKVPDDPWSSYAGRFVRRVTIYVALGAAVLAALWYFEVLSAHEEVQWIALGCLGSLLHLLNHALTTTRQQTFEPAGEQEAKR